MIPEAEDKALREIIVQGYRVMYRLESNRVLILAGMHGSRNVSGQEKKPWEDEWQSPVKRGFERQLKSIDLSWPCESNWIVMLP